MPSLAELGRQFDEPIEPTAPQWGSLDQLASMTHYPEQPNPAAPYLAAARELNPFGGRGVSEILKQRGVRLPQWSETLGDILQSEAANTAMGVMTPIKGGGVRLGVPEVSDLRQAANRFGLQGAPAPSQYFDALVLNKITPKEFEGFMDALGTQKPLTYQMIKDAQNQREQLLQATREQLSGMRNQGSISPAQSELPSPPAAANLNKTPTEQFIGEYDALVRKKAAELNREDFHIVPESLGDILKPPER